MNLMQTTSESDDFYYQIKQPCPLLRSRIHSYWILKEKASNKPIPEIAIADGLVELMFNYADPYHRLDITDQSQTIVSGSVIIGERTHTVGASKLHRLDMIGVNFYPMGAYQLFGIPLHTLNNQIIPLADIQMDDLMDLEDKLYEIKDDNAKFEYLDNFFLTKLSPLNTHQKRTAHILSHIAESGGNLKIENISQLYALTSKTLERDFKQYLGLTPKAYARIIRFQRFYRHLLSSPKNFYDSAYLDFGFYDQNHFIKEFKYFLGLTPTAFFRQSHPYSFYVSALRESQIVM
jgi:AraC-like DNA-binding protein